MRAVVMRDFGEADVLALEEIPNPEPANGEVLVRVGAVEVSRTRDAATRSGRHPFSQQVTLPHVLGGEFAGRVEAIGASVDPALLGRRVAASNAVPCGHCAHCASGHDEACESLEILGIHRRGSYAELVTVPAANIHELPDDLGYVEAAALAANGAIAYAQLEAGAVKAGTWVLVCGAAGALGSTLVVMAAARGANVVALSRRDPELVLAWGARAVLGPHDEDLVVRLREVTGDGVEVVIDNVALPEPFRRYMTALATRGRVVMSGAISQQDVAFAPLPFYLGSQSIVGVRTGNARTNAAFWDEVRRGLRLPHEVLTALPLADAATAHERVSSDNKVGHVLLTTGIER